MSSDPEGPIFDHEKMDVYAVALEFLEHSHAIIRELPRGRSTLADQLERAATSIVLNTAEGSGEFSRREKARFYRMALRSAAECGAVLRILTILGATSTTRNQQARTLLRRVAAMLMPSPSGTKRVEERAVVVVVPVPVPVPFPFPFPFPSPGARHPAPVTRRPSPGARHPTNAPQNRGRTIGGGRWMTARRPFWRR